MSLQGSGGASHDFERRVRMQGRCWETLPTPSASGGVSQSKPNELNLSAEEGEGGV